MPPSRHMQESRAVPVEPARGFDVVLAAPLPEIFNRRFGPIPPVREVRDQPPAWFEVGQTRTIVTADRGTMREELTVVEPPRRLGYRITDITGPMKPVVGAVDGEWRFEPAGTGVRITWSWLVHPASGVSSLAMPVFARLWHPYAARALEQIENLLLES